MKEQRLSMYDLKNQTEIVVQQALQDYMRGHQLTCACERCQADIIALALNGLPARYYVSLKGEILTKIEAHTLPDQAKILSSIVRAAQQVSASPSHPLEEI